MQQEYSKLAERYVRGLMTPQEREVFIEILSRDPKLAAELRLQKSELWVMETLSDRQLEQQMAQWDSAKKIQNRYRLAALAAFTLIVLSVWWWMYLKPDAALNTSPSPQMQMPEATDSTAIQSAPQANLPAPDNSGANAANAQSEQRYALAVRLSSPPVFDASAYRGSEKTDSVSVGQQLQEIESACQKKELDKAIALAQRLLQTDPGRSNRRKELLGTLYVQNRDFKAAVAVFESMSPNFREGAEWNLLLCYYALSGKNSPDFKALYETINNDHGHPAHDKLNDNKSLFGSK